MIAELYLIKGRTDDAKKQWEYILEKDPHVIPALNNLSVVLSRENPPQLGRAIELIERAYRMQPMNAEMCDTYGEVMMNAGRPIDAIAKLEESIRLDPKRIATRKRLAACYREIGMNDMASEQESLIQSLNDQPKSPPPQDSSR
jgi:Tfp pilus assembly protein PilF